MTDTLAYDDQSMHTQLLARLTDDARKSLDTISRGWRHVLDPIRTTGAGSTQGGVRPATEDEREEAPDARLDTPRTLAFWVHAAIDEWPVIMQRLVQVPVPTTDPEHTGWTVWATLDTIDCTDVPAMAQLLHREAERIAGWVEPGHDYGATFVADLAALARVVTRVAWPPKGDRLTIGECPECGRRVRVKAPNWLHMPQPTTDPTAYPEWAWLPNHARPIACPCGISDNLEGWIGRIVPFEEREPKTADEIIVIIQERMGLRYQPLTVRTWQRRGLIKIADYSKTGHARYDVTQVLAALADREKRRDRAS